jgi:Uma2 family endonuclease
MNRRQRFDRTHSAAPLELGTLGGIGAINMTRLWRFWSPGAGLSAPFTLLSRAGEISSVAMALAKPIHRLTEAEYLEIERHAEFKSEFFQGEMLAMAGETQLHSLIAANLIGELRAALRGRPCRVYTADLRIKAGPAGLYTYPDLSVARGEQTFTDGQQDTLLNPLVIVEVLSDSTEAYDRGAKFEFYRQIPSLQEYLLASQRQARIEQFIRRPGDEWLLREASGLDAKLSLPSLDITLNLREVFANVEFPPVTLHPERQTRN